MKITTIESNKNSFYRTRHTFSRYGEFHNISEFLEYCQWSKSNNIKLYILGNGSNTLFVKSKVKTLVLKNKLDKYIKSLPNFCLEVSSSMLISEVLKYCYNNSLDSFYYLASVPATIGGALAMNAGRGRNFQRTIYDFIENVDVFDFENNCVKTLTKEEIVKGYRETLFTGIQSKLIISAIFKFEKTEIKGNPIAERCIWSKKNQDHSAPNCGSVFKESDYNLLKKLKGLYINKANFSPKTNNWILNKSDSYLPLLMLITVAKIIHFLERKIAKLEIIIVD